MRERLRGVNREGHPSPDERIPRPMSWLVWGLLGGGVIVILLLYLLIPIIRSA